MIRNTTLGFGLVIAGLVAAQAWITDDPSSARPTSGLLGRAGASVPAPPASPSAARSKPAGRATAELDDGAIQRDIERLGTQLPRYPDETRRRFEDASELFQFVQSVLVPARAGDAAALHYVYIALEECRAYLGREIVDANANYEGLRAVQSSLTPDELLLADREYRRCRGFAGADLAPLLEAMGDDVPGATVEYAAVWFERAVQAGYPPALADLALRTFNFSWSERIELLNQAVSSGDPDVYWRLFGQASEQGSTDSMTAPAMAWLILACRAGLDCREDALWYRAWSCGIADSGPCQRGESAVEHYWYALPVAERARSYRLAQETGSHVAAGELDLVVWPALPGGGRDLR